MAKTNKFRKSLDITGEKEAAIEALTGKSSLNASDEEETTPFNCNLPKTLHERFKAKTKKEGRQMTWVIIRAIEQYLDE